MSNESAGAYTEESFSVEALISDLRRHARTFGIIAAVVFPVVFAAVYLQPKQFGSTAMVMITNDLQHQQVTGQQADDQPVDTASVESEVELLKSSAVADRVATDLHLDQDPEFNGSVPPSKLSLKYWLGLLHPKAQAASKTLMHESIDNELLGHLGVVHIGTTRLIKVSFEDRSPDKAATLVNAWVQAYLQTKIDTREAANQQANGWLSGRIDDLRKQVDDAERSVQEYKIQNNLLSATGSTLTEQEISDLDRQLATVQVDRAASEARLKTAKSQLASGSNGDDVGESLNSSVVSSLRSQAATISTRLADLQSRYGPMHPEVIKAKNELADINKQIQDEIQRIMSNLDAQDKIQQQRVASLDSSVQHAQGQLASNTKAMVKLNELELNAQSVRQIYESYLDRLKQTATQTGLQTANASVVAQGKVPTGPDSPKFAIALLLAFAAATVTGGAGAVMARAFDTGLTTSQNVENELNIRHLASVAELNSTIKRGSAKGVLPHKYLMAKSLSAFAEGFRNLRAAILYAPEKPPQVIALTSALPGEGKTTTAICLSAAFAMAGDSVVVVDCDLRRRSISRMFGTTPTKGMIEVLDQSATLEEALLKDEVTGVTYLPLSAAKTTTADVFGSEKFDKLLDELREKFSYVILDTAPVLPVADTRGLARKADFVAVLVRWRYTPQRAVQAALDTLASSQVKVSGIALTQVDIKAQGKFGYGDTGYYYKQYKNYYAEA